MLPQQVIRKKRDGQALAASDIQDFVNGITQQQVSEAQLAAFAMAVFLKGMDLSETTQLCCAMRDSGDKLQWDLPGPVLDKHSTGGVGDMVSLLLGPIVAACGGYIPMISGRGLGHSGGTVDKLESIPGYNCHPSNNLFKQCVTQAGIAIIGQTNSLAPADKRLYAARDISATVESIPLITTSILSKKLAEGLDGLVMDIKVGNGAFMTDDLQAHKLANSLVHVANQLGVTTHALLTDMNSPLAASAGNSLEIYECIQFLSGQQQHPHLKEVTLKLAAEMLFIGQLSHSVEEGLKMAETALDSGKAAEAFQKMCAILGGPANLLEKPETHLPKANVVRPVISPETGYVSEYNTLEIGMTVVKLGGGRLQSQDQINPAVGLSGLPQQGQKIQQGEPLLWLHAADEQSWQQANSELLQHIRIDQEPCFRQSRVIEYIRPNTLTRH